VLQDARRRLLCGGDEAGNWDGDGNGERVGHRVVVQGHGHGNVDGHGNWDDVWPGLPFLIWKQKRVVETQNNDEVTEVISITTG